MKKESEIKIKRKSNASHSPNLNKSVQSKSSTALGQLRIIGGKWRGRKLAVLNSPGLRPTGDRIKETLFNWLMPEIQDAICLDLFAGTGALGFEAASRFAQRVVMVEKSANVAKKIADNIRMLKTDNIQLVISDSLEFLQHPSSQTFDIVFIDPPFHQGLVQSSIDLILKQNYLHDQAWIYIESERNLPTLNLPTNWLLYREKMAGDVCYRLFKIA